MILSQLVLQSRVILASVLLVLVIAVTTCAADYDSREVMRGSDDRVQAGGTNPCVGTQCVKRTVNEQNGAMWFGPRLGRRRRSGKDLEFNSDIDSINDVLDGSAWTLIIPGDKRHVTQFTPRLGREIGDEYLQQFNSPLENENDIEQRPPPLFAPRLGRQLSFVPSPRLGRQIHAIFKNV